MSHGMGLVKLFLLKSKPIMQKSSKRKAVILFSGGLDSTTVLALAQSQGFACYCISFNYGQRHAGELAAATRLAADFQVAGHKIITL